VAEQVSPTVVVIQVARKPAALGEEGNPLWDLFRRQMEEEQEKHSEPREPIYDGQGSGVVIRKEGFILTNRHVVDGAEKIKVRFSDRTEYEAEVQGVDRQSDIAVLKITPEEDLPAAALGDSSRVRVGEFAIAIGAPFLLDYSVTFGHVSAKGRSHIIPDPEMDQEFIQTDANINPGNSGGPLVNIKGEVIGINTLIRGLRTGIGFAIPINLAMEVADKLVTEGKYVRAFLGIQIKDLRSDPEFRAMVPGLEDGVIVLEIRPEGPAIDSDLRAGDVVTAVDGVPVATGLELKAQVRRKPIGKPIKLDVHRRGKDIKVEVKAAAWPENPLPLFARQQVEPPAQEKPNPLGLKVQTLTPELAKEFAVRESKGVIVTEVEEGGSGESAGLRPGDVITEFDQKSIATAREFREAVEAADLTKGAIILFSNRGTSKFKILKEGAD